MKHPQDSDVAVILHSSGSSTLPKPVTLTHRALLQWGLVPCYGEVDICGQIISAHALCMHHALRLALISWTAVTGAAISSFSPMAFPSALQSGHVLAQALVTRSNILISTPAFIEAWAAQPKNIAALRRFTAVIFTGATLQKTVGDRLVDNGVRILSLYGATEIGCISLFLPSDDSVPSRNNEVLAAAAQDSWEYFRISPHCNAILMPQYDNVHSMLIMDSPTFTPHVYNLQLNGVKGYDTGDLMVRHPTNPVLWRVFGRADEQIHHSTGHKTNPVPIESFLTQHPRIRGCLMFGRGRCRAGIIIEPTPDCTFNLSDSVQRIAYCNEIWPAVEEINAQTATHSQLLKEMVIITHPSRPFRYTPKNTPHRSSVLDAYEKEIEAVYEAMEEISPTEKAMASTDEEADFGLVARKAVEKVMHFPIADDADIFQNGCDSLQATLIRNTILSALRTKINTYSVPHNFVYSNPTIRRLGAYLSQYGHGFVALAMMSSKVSEMERLVDRYSGDFTPPRPRSSEPSPGVNGEVVLLTGSTGALGSYVLEHLLKDPAVARVYALNRPDARGVRSVLIRQVASFRDRELDFALLNSERLVLLEGNIAEPNFGLDDETYEEIRVSVTCIIHQAWRIDFNVVLSSLEPLIAATRRLVDLALSSPHAETPRFVFASSHSLFCNWPEGVVVPEEANLPPVTAVGSGYAESKWVAENILVRAAAATTLRPVIARIGQVSGGPNGSWSPGEWLPTLVRSAQLLRRLPHPHGHVSWIPAHRAAAALVELRHSIPSAPSAHFVHLVHPAPVPSDVLFSALAAVLGVPLVPYADWLAVLEASTHAATAAAPALAFGLANMATELAVLAAPQVYATLRGEQLGRADVETWVRYWRKIGFLAP
ncbi:hypothetical protein B0H10DRAFT_2224315 [Mycena sp. CBHHK59/15]|nr:hypothetical protein B0H10DRAFT_2224315 [Mycena sp. CBHHK59/15]